MVELMIYTTPWVTPRLSRNFKVSSLEWCFSSAEVWNTHSIKSLLLVNIHENGAEGLGEFSNVLKMIQWIPGPSLFNLQKLKYI